MDLDTVARFQGLIGVCITLGTAGFIWLIRVAYRIDHNVETAIADSAVLKTDMAAMKGKVAEHDIYIAWHSGEEAARADTGRHPIMRRLATGDHP